MVISIKNIFNLFMVVLAVFALGLNRGTAQDLFDFPDDDPIAEKAEPAQDPPAKQDDQDDANPLKSDPLLGDDDEGEPVPMEQDPLLDGDDDEAVIRPNQPQGGGDFTSPPDEEERPGQSVVLNSKFAGWEQAGASVGGKRLSTALRANWIMVNANGRFTGRVLTSKDAGVEDMVVYLLSQGRIVREARVENNGVFEFSNIAEGPYALVGWAENAFFAFGLNILEFDEQNISKVRNNIRVKAIQNKTTLNTDWITYFTPKVAFRIFGRYSNNEGLDDPVSLYGIEGLSNNIPDAEPATSIDSRPVTRTPAGGLLGRVHQLNSQSGSSSSQQISLGRPVDVRGTRIMLLQGDDVVAATDADNYGVFFFPNVEVGEYGLLAAGVDGAGLIGIDVIDAEEEKVIINEEGQLVDEKGGTKKAEPFPVDFCLVSAETMGWMNHNATEMAYRRNLLAPRRPSPDDLNRMCAGCEGSGCQHCQGTGICSSRCQSFEDWAMNCCNQHQKTKLGSGYILSEASKDVRRIVNRSTDYFEKAFYGNESGGQFGNQNGAGFQNGGQNFDPGSGYQSGGIIGSGAGTGGGGTVPN